MSKQWSPDSWRELTASQQPNYPDATAVAGVLAELHRLPPLVTSWEIESLKEMLADAANGNAFLLQGGDCAENFEECTSEAITSKLKILLQMSLVLVHGSKRRVIRVGRFAGQYTKPRSEDLETIDGVELPSYRGDLVNGLAFTEEARIPDPNRMLLGYSRSALTLNFIRSLIDGGFADLHHPEYWDLGFVEHSPDAAEYQRIVSAIGESLRFMETLAGESVGAIRRVEFFSSHEGLHLPYEQALTRQVPRREGWYDLSTHLPWIGMRTATLREAHVEFFRGVRNPIGVKIGPTITTQALIALIEALDPDHEPGRLSLIHRFGVREIALGLPPLIEAAASTGRKALGVCDPMHGNTQTTSSGRKTRRFDDILSELEWAFDIHAAQGSYLGGVHFELTGEDVTECVGGARGLAEADLERAYRSQVDPRLNYEQALEMALLVGRKMGSIDPALVPA